MAQSRAAIGPISTAIHHARHRLRAAARSARVVVIICLVLICGSFAAAALIQMRLDRAHALSQARAFGARRAEEMAIDLGSALDRDRTIGRTFAESGDSAETAAALSEIGGEALRNVVVLDWRGKLQSELTRAPRGFLPLAGSTLAAAHAGAAVIPAFDGRTLAIAFPVGSHVVAVQIDASLLVHPASMEDGLIATPSGLVLALGSAWHGPPPQASIALGEVNEASRVVKLSDGARLVSLARVSHWPLEIGTSARVDEALGAWYGALPLYLFFILGPAVSGAALAAVLVRAFDRQARAAAAVRALRSTRPEEARLLVRLADAERRAKEAEERAKNAQRAKGDFVARMSHELRTPLNAIIGFSDVIAAGVFGAHEKYSEYARDITEAGRDLHAKISAVLEFASAQMPSLPLQTVDAAKIVRLAITEAEEKAKARGIALTVSIAESAQARANAGSLARIVAHLLANALGYTPRGGAIAIELYSGPGGVTLRLHDTGVGFSEEEKSRLGLPFEQFQRPNAAGGMGLGLATAFALAAQMNATLSLSSELGEGTLAELRLPGG